MGGFGSGGSRVGAGRPAKNQQQARLHGTRQRSKMARPSASTARLDLIPAPDGMGPKAVAAWNENAPAAIQEQTLHAATVGAFREFCELIVERDRVHASLQAFQWPEQTSSETNQLATQWRALCKEVRMTRAAFRLAPVGKAAAVPDAPADPFDEFDGAVQ